MGNCNICGSDNYIIFEANVLNKIPVSYYKCKSCEFVQTEKPFWLDESYSSAITSQDIGLISRNITFAPLITSLINIFFNANGKFLDYGGGYGMFVRLMRDRGYNFKRFDTFCENIFAKDFDCNGDEKYELITSMEVFEHLEDPLGEIENMLLKSSSIFFTTELQPTKFEKESDWWYVMPETGQHISLFSYKSLKFIAIKYNLNLYSNGFNFHLLTNKKINPVLFKLATNKYVSLMLNKLLFRRSSLLWSDYLNIVKK